MDKSFNKDKRRKLLTLLLSAFMFSSTAATFAACGSNDSSDVDDSEVTFTPSDSDRVKNGSFEFYDDNDGKTLIVTSPTGWTKSTGSSTKGSAYSSKTASGIIDTAKWDELTKSNLTTDEVPETEAEAKALWENMSVFDKLKFYKTWTDADDDNEISDLSFYDSDTDNYNIDYNDIPACENPLTHYNEGDEGYGEKTSVLMLHNSYSTKRDEQTDKRGTAQKFTSSTTVTVPMGASANFSVWVKTADLTSSNSKNDESQPVSVTGQRGAYIGVTQSVGGQSLDEVQIKNIDTTVLNPEGDNNGWVQYNFLLKGSSYASTTFTIVLGLGQGGGTDRWEYVDGYAFFDDVKCELVSSAKHAEDLGALTAGTYFSVNPDTEAIDRKFAVDESANKDIRTCVIDCDYSANDWNNYTEFSSSALTTSVTQEEKFGTVTSSKVEASAKDKTGLFSYDALTAEANSNAMLKKVMDADFEKYPFQNKDKNNLIMLYSESGAAYEAVLDSDLKVNQKSVKENSYIVVSFFLKTSDLTGGFTGASVTLTETSGTHKETVLLSGVNTNAVTKVELDGDDNEDIFDGWQQYLLVIENSTETQQKFTLTFNYGPTGIVASKAEDYRAGYAAFANFATREIDAEEYKRISSGDYVKTLTISDPAADSSNSGFDSPSSVPYEAIKNEIAQPKNYTGVNGGSAYVVPGAADKTTDSNAMGDSVRAGLINKDYASAYASAYTDLTGITFNDNLFGDSKQPLLIYNKEESAFGYFGTKQTIGANAYVAVSVKVKVSAGATANVYLVDKSNNSSVDPLSISTLSYGYWYDAKGNICSKDPSKNSFDKDKDVAFELNDKGLYEVKKSWTGYKAEYAGKLYANLKNYEKDADGNLIVADGGASYNYDSTVWSHAGNNGIAFYAKDGKYYAYKSCKAEDEVFDLSSIEGLARYADNAKTGVAQMTIGNTNGEWVNCTFYIRSGGEDKSYRLEVWSGSRDNSVKSAANSYVLFDMNSLTVDESTYADLLEENVELVKGDATDEAFRTSDLVAYTAFSFLDSAKYLRYDSTLDKEDVGNSYDDYMASADYTEGVAYLKSGNVMFFDYNLTEATVSLDKDTDDDEDTDTDDDDTDVDGLNIWLLVSSLILAAVLLLTIVSLVVQKILKKHGHGKATKAPRVKKSKEEKQAEKEKKAEKKAEAKKEVKEEIKDENDPYND